jgi:hypothetical protein
VVLCTETLGVMVKVKEGFGLKFTAFVEMSVLEHLYYL